MSTTSKPSTPPDKPDIPPKSPRRPPPAFSSRTTGSQGFEAKSTARNRAARKRAGVDTGSDSRVGSGSSQPESTRRKTGTAEGMPSKLDNLPLSRWILLALASGCFAALNGAFAKLVTTSLTSTLSGSISSLFSLSPSSTGSKFIELLTRATFFLLNLASNAIMWALFTRALTSHPSATKVSLVNTSGNFLLTAVLGWMVFSERLQGLWWLGAALLVVGTVIIGRDRGEEGKEEGTGEGAIRLEGEDAGTGAAVGVGVGRSVGVELGDREREPGLGEGERDLLVGDEEGVDVDGERDGR